MISSSDINIPWFRNMFDPKKSRSGRLLWKLLVFFFGVISAIQTYQRIHLFFEHPVDLSFEFQKEKFLQFPSVTVCSSRPFDRDIVLSNLRKSKPSTFAVAGNFNLVYELLPHEDLDTIWELSGMDLDAFLKKVGKRIGHIQIMEPIWRHEKNWSSQNSDSFFSEFLVFFCRSDFILRILIYILEFSIFLRNVR